MRQEFRPQARQEFLDATRWYLEEGGPPLAERFSAAIEQALRMLAVMPRLGKPQFHETRCWALRRFPYTIVYRVQGELMTIIAVAHQSREPEYWTGR